MTDKERIWGETVNKRVLEQSYNRFVSAPIIDIAIGYELGMSPDEMADALVGTNPKGFAKIISRMKETGLYDTEE